MQSASGARSAFAWHWSLRVWQAPRVPQSVLERVSRLLAREPVDISQVTGRGYTPALRYRIAFRDGGSVFVKLAPSASTAANLRVEARRYRQLRADFVPVLHAFEDGEQPMLVLEDFSHAHWPPLWLPGQPELVLAALARLAATRPVPAQLPELESLRPVLSGWSAIARDATVFLALDLCSQAWLRRALPALLHAERAAVLGGDDLLHLDVRSDNLCLVQDRVVFVDWSSAVRGNALVDRAFFAPSLRLEGGPLPDAIVPDAPELAGLVAGFFAARAGLPAVPDAPRVRPFQLRQLRIALAWAVRALQLDPPDRPWARLACARIDAALVAGEIDRSGWHARMEEVIGDAYLAAADPRAQSGKSGDEADWRWSRELILDALPAGGSILDVGCANGHLIESLQRWAAERGVSVEVHGLELSPRLAGLARARLPAHAGRIHVGNVLEWTSELRFDLVHTGLDYVPAPQRRALLLRVLHELVRPGGKLVLRAERVRPGEPDLLAQVQALDLRVGGVLESVHPRSGELRRTVWLDAPL